MKINLDSKALQALFDSKTYREFIQTWMTERSKIRRFGFSDIARNGNFAARSFPRDVVQGTKRITLRSLDRFTVGLGLTADLAAYFKLLVEIEEPECRTGKVTVRKLERSRALIRTRLLGRAGYSLTAASTPSDEIFLEDFPRIYAGLGSEENGATLEDVARRTKLPTATVRSALTKCVATGWARKEKNRYYPSMSHVNLEGLKTSIPFQQRFTRSCLRVVKEVEHRLESPEALFFSSAISVRATDLPALKEDFRSLLLRYVEASEFNEGDRVVEIVAAMI